MSGCIFDPEIEFVQYNMVTYLIMILFDKS